MKKNLIYIGLFILVIGVIIVFSRSKIKQKDELIGLLTEDIHKYEKIIIDKDRKIYTQKQTLSSLENALEAELVNKKELKEKNIKLLESIVRFQDEIKRLNTIIELQKPETIIIEKTDTIYPPGTYLKVPVSFNYKDKWLFQSGRVLSSTIEIDTLLIKSDYTITLGWEKTGFFDKMEPVVFVENKNIYSDVSGMQNVVIVEKPPIYKRPWWYRMEGFIGSALIGYFMYK